MTIYLGPPGALQALPYMGRGIGAPLDLGAAVQQSLGGQRTVDYVGAPRGSYALERKYLTDAEVSQVVGLALGAYGGDVPLALIDPWRINMLTPNQSTAGDTARGTSGFTAMLGSLSLGADSAVAAQGRRWMEYLSPASGAAGTAGLLVGDRDSAADVLVPGNATPVRASVAHTFQAQVKTVAGTAAAWRAALLWFDEAGVLISTSNGTGATVTASFAAFTVTATSPSNAAYVVPGITNNATLTATNTIAADALMLAAASATGTWQLGLGTPRVAFVGGLDLSYPNIVGARDLAFALQEVG